MQMEVVRLAFCLFLQYKSERKEVLKKHTLHGGKTALDFF